MVQPFLGSQAVAEGVVSKKQLRSSAWRQLFRDVYVRSNAEVTHEVWCRAAALVLPRTGAISGVSAALLHGADVVHSDAPVEATSAEHVRPRTRLRVRRSELCSDDVVEVQGLRVTSLVRTAFDVAREPGLDEAIVATDALLNMGSLSPEEIATYAAERRSWPGVRQLIDVLTLAAVGAESPMETRLRLLLVRAGLPVPTLQHRVHDERGFFIARLDCAYVLERLGVEYDGQCHFDASSVRKDLRRQNALRAAGWSLLRFTSDDVFRHSTRTVAQVRAALTTRLSR